jgi:hypothetical protein
MACARQAEETIDETEKAGEKEFDCPRQCYPRFLVSATMHTQ